MPSSSVPDVLGQVVRYYRAGDREAALTLWEEYLPLIHNEYRQCGLRAAKVLLHEGGVIRGGRFVRPRAGWRPSP